VLVVDHFNASPFENITEFSAISSQPIFIGDILQAIPKDKFRGFYLVSNLKNETKLEKIEGDFFDRLASGGGSSKNSLCWSSKPIQVNYSHIFEAVSRFGHA